MSILLAYEDRYCRGLDLTIRRAINRAGVLTVPREFIPVDGVSNFLGFVEGIVGLGFLHVRQRTDKERPEIRME